jgi:hypothetical protein
LTEGVELFSLSAEVKKKNQKTVRMKSMICGVIKQNTDMKLYP